jgi:rhodanese-related sulfurtransferase
MLMRVSSAEVDDILAAARVRARPLGLRYAGALLPREAHFLRQQVPGARLVDVRSKAEWEFVGRVPEAVEIEWKRYPGMQLNPDFLQQLSEQVPHDALVMFLCRSGGRSHDTAALAASAGYSNAYNVLEGFEGDRDPAGHRNTIGGWRAAGLPWIQS